MIRSTAGPTAAALLALTFLIAGCTAEPTPDQAVLTQPGPPPPPGATGAPVIGVTTLPPVPVGTPAAFGGGLVATVATIDQIQVEARGPGEIAGPGAAVTVEFTNESSEPIDLSGIAVNAYGDGDVPASSTDSTPSAPVSGSLPSGEKRLGVYVFQIAVEEASSLLVEINYNGSPNVVLIRR